MHPIVGADLLKALYYDREPNGSVVFETNEVGLKGDPLDGQRNLAVIWGDSVVFGRGRGWPCLLDRLAAGYQFLNGGLEGGQPLARRRMFLYRSRTIEFGTALSPPGTKTFEEGCFYFVGDVPYQMAGQGQGYEHIVERNAIAREVCSRLGIRLFALFAALDTENLSEFREHFIDMIHLRPRAYPLVAQLVYDGIEDLIG